MEFIKKFPSEIDIIKLYIKFCYNDGVICSHCGSNKISCRLYSPKFFQCNNCNNSFSIFKDTIFENTTTDLRKWLYVAVQYFINNETTINIKELQSEIDVTYKTAWRIFKKIKEAISDIKNVDFFKAIVDVL